MYKSAFYKLVPSKKTGYIDCHIIYKVNGKEYIHFISIKKNDDFTDGDYLRYAKKRFILDVNTKRTASDRHKFSFRIPFIVVASLFVASAITIGTLCGLGYIGNGGVTPAPAPIQKEYTINFLDSETGATLSEQQKVEYNHKVQRPETPTKEGYTFDKWYKEDKTTPYTFDDPLVDETVNEINLYGKFNINKYRVNYVAKGGTIEDDRYFDDVHYNGIIEEKPIVRVDGEPVETTWWWTPNYDEGTEFIFNVTRVTSPMTLYAKYNSETEAVDFKTDSWPVFLGEINEKSFDDIKNNSAYSDDYKENQNTFVGLTREIFIEDGEGESYKYNLIVVDEKTDATASEGKFTFMITDLSDPSKFDNANNFYPDSNINLYLQGVLNGFEREVKGHVADSDIDCMKIGSSGQEIVSSVAKIYIPSAQQIFGNGEYVKENDQFVYFSKNPGQISSLLNGAWLRTPINGTAARTYYVNNGNVEGDDVDKEHSIRPVFVIK